MINFIKTKPFHVLVFLSALVLMSVYFIEHVLGHAPCKLCLYQRLPWYGLLMLGLLGWRWQNRLGKSSTVLGLLIILVLLFSAGLSGYHTGVEFAWWQGPTTCGGVTGQMNAEDLKAALLATKPVRCDEVSFRIFGGSLTFWNFVLSIALSPIVLMSLLHLRRKSV